MGSTTPRPAWCPWKKKPELEDVSKPKVSYTANLHRANARIERNVSWWTLEATATVLKFLPFATVLRNPWQGLTLTCSGPVSVAARHLSIPQRRVAGMIRRPSTLPRNWRFTFPFCSCHQERHSFCATWKCQTRARLGEKEAYQLPLNSEQRKYFGRRNGLHSFHCMHYALNVSRAFRCPPPFCARTFDE